MYHCFATWLKSKNKFVVNTRHILNWFAWSKWEISYVRHSNLIMNEDYVCDENLEISKFSLKGLEKLCNFINNERSQKVLSVMNDCKSQFYNEPIPPITTTLPEVFIPRDIAIQMCDLWNNFLHAEDTRRLISWQRDEYRKQTIYDEFCKNTLGNKKEC